jgi:hypothetical protein
MCNNREFYDKLTNILRYFHGLDDMVLFCYNYPRKQNDTLKSTENKIQNIMTMNQLLDNVMVLKEILKDSIISEIQNFNQVITINIFKKKLSFKISKYLKELFGNNKFEKIKQEIEKLINDDNMFKKNNLNLRISRCYAIKVYIVNWITYFYIF